MTKHITLLILLSITLVTAGDVWAQEPPRAGRPNRPRLDGLTPADVEDMLDALALVQAEKVLQVAEAQYPEFVTRLKTLHETRKRNRQTRFQIVRELQRLTAPQRGAADEVVLRERLKALRDHDGRAAAELARAYDALDQVLDARQQARFRVFELNMERQKLDMLLRARQGAARRTGPGTR
jgi:hypothetical protein